MVENEKINLKNDPSKLMDFITDNIALGEYWAAYEKDYLISKKIKKILICGNDLKAFFPKDFIYLKLDLIDKEDFDLIPFIDEAIEFIKNTDEINKVLVHCQFGVSRSASILIAFLMKEKNINYDEALTIIKGKRPQVQPNSGFEKQLKSINN